MRPILFFVCTLLSMGVATLHAQQTFPQNGVFDERDGHYAFTNATIYATPTQKIEKGTLLIKKGKIVAAGTNITIPNDAVVVDLQGKYIYPSFIDLYSNYGMPDPKAISTQNQHIPQYLTNKQGAFAWNEALRPEYRANEQFKNDSKKAEDLRKAGFGAVVTHQFDGIARGSGALVLIGNDREHELIVQPTASAHFSFNKGTSTQEYPSSLMGVIALLRQTHFDAQWYKRSNLEYNASLERWNELAALPAIIECNDKLNILRADKICDEFGYQYIIKTGGDEYQRVDAVKKTNAPLIVPINFPLPYDVTDPYNAQQIAISLLKHWELAPSNPAILAKNGVEFAITMNGISATDDFWANLRKAYQFGLSEADLLKALTVTPARLVRADKQLGTLEAGKIANFFISSTNILSEKSTILHHWVGGKPNTYGNVLVQDFRGKYDLAINNNTFYLDVKGSADRPDMFLKTAAEQKDTTKTGTKISYELDGSSISFAFIPQKDTSKKEQEQYRLNGKIAAAGWSGKAFLPNGAWVNWSATFREAAKKDTLELVKRDSSVLGEIIYPFGAYGRPAAQLPKAETVLFKNATVWTGEADGVLTETDVLVEGGKIKQIGKNLNAGAAKTVDATGKHLTAGIIDEHSHISISGGVNEATQASSAEVSIGDVVTSEDINMYRQLAGGVVAAQLLHGSANPIGGQSALIKLRWGSLPEDIKIKDAPKFIKFALGENVKQTNWGDYNTIRFPQSRMGVEQVYEDHFTRAREYGNQLKKGLVRRDIELDILLEILESKRFISCHSYVQSEITMLMRVAERHKFRVNTFTHILEGYKVADKMKQHGVGASSFADWWAYKMEVMDAIPYNAFIMNKMGIVTAINSDDAEMGRRLNQEAAKSVKYGGMSEHDAWKMVTINPAKLLHLDDQTGSIKVGKSADVVLWSDNPLSIYAKPVKTFVDGVCLFDIEEDKKLRQNIQIERSRIVQKMLNAKSNGAKTQPTLHVHERHYHCGDASLNELKNQ